MTLQLRSSDFTAFNPACDGLNTILGSTGSLSVRLAQTPLEVEIAQCLRYRIFYAERDASFCQEACDTHKDVDCYDTLCDHLLVIDHSKEAKDTSSFLLQDGALVGTYRLLRQENLPPKQGFYSQQEFDLKPLLARHSSLKFLELGRSCVLQSHRTKRSLELLWHGIWAYVLHFDIDLMFGCASFEGHDLDKLCLPLSFLHHYAKASTPYHVKAHDERRAAFECIAKENLHQRQALKALPPLLKGYLRLGARFGEGAVIDPDFNTVDVMVIMPIEKLDPRYVRHYGKNAERFQHF